MSQNRFPEQHLLKPHQLPVKCYSYLSLSLSAGQHQRGDRVGNSTMYFSTVDFKNRCALFSYLCESEYELTDATSKNMYVPSTNLDKNGPYIISIAWSGQSGPH